MHVYTRIICGAVAAEAVVVPGMSHSEAWAAVKDGP